MFTNTRMPRSFLLWNRQEPIAAANTLWTFVGIFPNIGHNVFSALMTSESENAVDFVTIQSKTMDFAVNEELTIMM